MSSFSETHLPCSSCGSSDARSIYQSGVSKCFSCGETLAPEGTRAPTTSAPTRKIAPLRRELEFHPLPSRGITVETARRYGYAIDTDGTHCAPYHDSSGRIVAQKLRKRGKRFSIAGDSAQMGLFGSNLARRGGKQIVITEGEIDAMSVSQALGNTWPAVSLPNGAGDISAVTDALEWLSTYDRVVLMLDNDEPGHAATEAILGVLPPGLGCVATLGSCKDANEVLVQSGAAALRQAVWEAKEWRPDGVINLGDLRDRVQVPLSHGTPYPWGGLQSLTYGTRPSELVTWCAGTGTGKSAVLAELGYHYAIANGLTIGVIALEESVERLARRYLAVHTSRPVHLPGHDLSPEQFTTAWDETLGSGRIMAWDHFGSCDTDLLTNRVRWMAAAGVQVVILDHVSMVVSGSDMQSDERRLLDQTMTRLRSLSQETGIMMHIVSHLRRGSGQSAHEEGRAVSLQDLRGTQAIAQLSDCVVALERDQQAEGDARHLTQLRVLKNRYTGMTGTCGYLRFDPETHRLSETEVFGDTEINVFSEDF